MPKEIEIIEEPLPAKLPNAEKDTADDGGHGIANNDYDGVDEGE